METKKEIREQKTPGIAFALIEFIVIIAVIIVLTNIGVNTALTVFIGAALACILALSLRVPWGDIEDTVMSTLKDCSITFLVVIMVGMLVGLWMANGTVPSLMYYGMKLISPVILLPLTFILCCFTSLFTGTSFGSIATMGIAMVGVASTTSLPVPLVVGAVASGAYFGDKMSPLSDCTNLAAGITKVGLYDHINSMYYSTIPAALVCAVMYTVAGFIYGGGAMDTEKANLICNTLADNFHISVVLILPAVLVLLVSAFKIPAILGLGITAGISIIFGMVFQGTSFIDLLNYAYNGFSIDTGVDIVNPMLNRGGIVSMTELLVIYILSSTMGAFIASSGIMDVIAQKMLLKVIKNKVSLIVVTLIYGHIMTFAVAGVQTVTMIVTAQTFEEVYDKMGISRRVLSRMLEDSGVLGCLLVPWGITAMYIATTLGVSNTAYIPYAWLVYAVPVFSIICAVTGFGMWDKDEKPMWNKKGEKV